jgi:hypothetical protein
LIRAIHTIDPDNESHTKCHGTVHLTINTAEPVFDLLNYSARERNGLVNEKLFRNFYGKTA